MTLETARAVKDVTIERLRQDERWGVQNHDPAEWLAILTEEVGEVAKEVAERRLVGRLRANYRNELVQVAAVAVAAIESLDRNS